MELFVLGAADSNRHTKPKDSLFSSRMSSCMFSCMFKGSTLELVGEDCKEPPPPFWWPAGLPGSTVSLSWQLRRCLLFVFSKGSRSPKWTDISHFTLCLCFPEQAGTINKHYCKSHPLLWTWNWDKSSSTRRNFMGSMLLLVTSVALLQLTLRATGLN